MVRIIMCGCNGHMGKVITDIVEKDQNAEIVAGIDISGQKDTSYPVYPDLSQVKEEADVVIDFSSPKVLSKLLADAKQKTGLSLVLCSTGYTKDQMEEIKLAATEIPIMRSANMSLGVNVLTKLVQLAAAKLCEEGFDIEIVEKHHRLKKDAPSGTALALADAINEVLNNEYSYIYDRSQRSEQRPEKEIGISAVRGGTIVGEHEILFAGRDEVIEIKHTAYSKEIFGKGAVVAAKFMTGQPAGLYTMQDAIN